MQYFDLHCDTLYRATIDDSDFNNPDYHVCMSKTSELSIYKQMFAIWIPDEYRGEDATRLFNCAVNDSTSADSSCTAFHNTYTSFDSLICIKSPNAPSACMLLLVRSNIPIDVVILARDCFLCSMNFFDTCIFRFPLLLRGF